MKIGHLSRNMQWLFPQQCVEAKSNNSGWYATTKNVNVSTTCHMSLSINYSLTTTFHAVQVDLLSADAWHPTLHEGQPSGHWGSGVQSHSTQWLSWSHRFSLWFRSGETAGHSIRGTLVSSSCSLTMRPWWAGALSHLKMKLGLCPGLN